MANLAIVLKDEIRRLARKEIKLVLKSVNKPRAAARRAIAGLKRRVASLEKANRKARSQLDRMPEPQASAGADAKVRITAKGMRGLRRKLRLSQLEFGKLLGVTGNNVYQWERKNGPLRVREATKTAILRARAMGARDARDFLEELAATAQPGRRSKRAK
jgi:DNA-binding transcriptional regulator YiaG